MKYSIHLFIFLSVFLISSQPQKIYGQGEYFLLTVRYSDDDGSTYINRSTKFTVDLSKMELTITQSGIKSIYEIVDAKAEPDERTGNGLKSTTIFECISTSKEFHLFIMINDVQSDGTSKVTMGDMNMKTNRNRIYFNY